jgi:prevent-host-death family protein
MTTVNIHEAKTNLSKLLEKALNGEEVVIARSGKPLVKLVPIKEKEEWFGMDEGKVWIADDFDELDPEILALFNGENIESFD